MYLLIKSYLSEFIISGTVKIQLKKKTICIIFWYYLGNQIETKPFCQGNSTVVSSSVLNNIKWPWPYFEIYSFGLDLSLIVDAIKTSSK